MVVHDHPFVVVGAGLAGLTCAKYLQDAGIPYLVLDENAQVGGRVVSRLEQGCILDAGFQVILNSYPEFKNYIDLKKLEMRYFNSGCLIYTPEKMQNLANPILHPSQLLNETLSSFVDIKDKSNVLSLILKSHFGSDKTKKTSTIKYLKAYGFSEHFIEMFWRPFFAGVLLDENLTVDSHFFLFLMKCFSTGTVGVPAHGMQALPNEIYNMLKPDSVRLGCKVKKIAAQHVELENGEIIKASGVAVSRAPEEVAADFFSVENLYFTTSEKLDWGKWLVIVPPKFNLSINNIALMSEVAPEYVQNRDETLVSVSVLTSRFVSDEKVAEELRVISGKKLSDLKLIKRVSVKKALPKNFGTKHGYLKQKDVFYFGDWATTPSINGAIESGRKLAQHILLKADRSLISVSELLQQ